ncbi:hypothetical protein PUN28_009196 [Cardiocondyla obscurior]|uniref:Ribosomal protein L20 n=1 Tax=Cardiocondyla obscurior TaxID=286306 RepID=A0AAW2FSP7_9HYME
MKKGRGEKKKASINTAGTTKISFRRASETRRSSLGLPGTHKEAIIMCVLLRARSHGREHDAHAQFRRNKRICSHFHLFRTVLRVKRTPYPRNSSRQKIIDPAYVPRLLQFA